MKTKINYIEYILKDKILSKNLLEYLREDLDLTGTKKGCEVGACGVCTVLIDGKAVQSCVRKVEDIIGKEVITIEGIESAEGALSFLQDCFIKYGAIQCGYCTPAMVLRGHSLLLKNSSPTRDEIKKAINPVLCRCTGYQQIIDAIEAAAPSYKK